MVWMSVQVLLKWRKWGQHKLILVTVEEYTKAWKVKLCMGLQMEKKGYTFIIVCTMMALKMVSKVVEMAKVMSSSKIWSHTYSFHLLELALVEPQSSPPKKAVINNRRTHPPVTQRIHRW